MTKKNVVSSSLNQIRQINYKRLHVNPSENHGVRLARVQGDSQSPGSKIIWENPTPTEDGPTLIPESNTKIAK